MKKFLFTYLLSLVVILGYSTEYERYLQTSSAGDFSFLFSSGIKYAQTFTVGNTGANESFVIDSIHIGETVGGFWQNATIEIQTVSSEIPTGTVISNKVSYNLYTQMIIMSPAALQPSTKYAIVIYDEITSSGISAKVVGSSDYTGGKLLYKNGSDPWTDAVTNPTIIPTDLMRFRIYGKHAPIITSQPTSATKCVGTSQTFSVVVDSDSPAYQWRKSYSNISGATSSSYTISSVVSGSAGTYDCVVTESLLGTTTTSNTVTLTVPTTTSISGHPTSISRCVGTSATFSVTAAGTGLTYQWKKNGSNISGQTGTSYTISSVATGDAANYTVTVTGTCGTVTSNTATLTVNTPPSITSHPSSGTGCEGFTLNLSVTATGSSLTYQWRRNAVNISGATSSTYSKSGITTADAGSYTCVVTGACGSATSNEAIIVILTTPSMTSHPTSATVCYQDNPTLSATATGGSLTYQWKLDNVNISGATSNSYAISSLDYQDIGVYTLAVSNICGSTTSNPATLTMNTESYLPLRNNLISYWDMESAVSTEEDIVGSNDATVSGATSVTLGTNPPFGKAYSFDGTNDRLTMSAISLGNNLTLSAWVNASTTGLVSRNIIARTNYGTDGIGISSTGKWYGQYAGTTVYSSSNYTTGWHYITFTYDYSTGYIRLYVDGSQVGSGTNAIYAETNAAASWSIGSSGSSSRYWSGYIDEVSMFNRVLSASEILGIYNSGVVEGYNVFLTTCDTEPIPETRRKKILLAGKLRNINLADIERDFGYMEVATDDAGIIYRNIAHDQAAVIDEGIEVNDYVVDIIYNKNYNRLKGNNQLTYYKMGGSNSFDVSLNGGYVYCINDNPAPGNYVVKFKIEDATNGISDTATCYITVIDSSNCKYVNPLVSVSGTGTKANPYKSMMNVTWGNTNVFVKRGTQDNLTDLTKTVISNSNNLVGAYGSGARPILANRNGQAGSNKGIFTFSGNFGNVTIRDVDLYDYDDQLLAVVYSLSGYTQTNMKFDNCIIRGGITGEVGDNTGTYQGMRLDSDWNGGGMISNCEVFGVLADGIYCHRDLTGTSVSNYFQLESNYVHHVDYGYNEGCGGGAAGCSGDPFDLGPRGSETTTDTSINGDKRYLRIALNHAQKNFPKKHGILYGGSIYPTFGRSYAIIEENYVRMWGGSYNGYSNAGISLYGAKGATVRYNVIENSVFGIYSPNDSPEYLREGVNQDIQVYGNLIYNTYGFSFFLQANCDNWDIWNNTTANWGLETGSQYRSALTLNGASSVDFRNNILVASSVAATLNPFYNGSGLIEDYNLIYPALNGWTKGAHTIVSDPLFVTGENSEYEIGVNSPAYHGGIDLNIDRDLWGIPFHPTTPSIGYKEKQ